MNKKTQRVLKHHHKKPYRAHHITLAGFALFLLLVSGMYIAIFYMFRPTAPPASEELSAQKQTSHETASVRSSYGFSIDVNLADFTPVATLDDTQEITEPDELKDTELAIASLKLQPNSGIVTADARASALTISNETALEESSLEVYRDTDKYEEIDNSEETIAGEPFSKSVYRYIPRSSDDSRDIYTITWEHQSEVGHYTIVLQGMLNEPALPSPYAKALDTLRFGETLGVQFFSSTTQEWINRSDSTRQYLSDLLSPAVVKLYHLVCGEVQFELQDIPEPQCRATTGTGFFISRDGHIATNGHVVVYEPEDALVDTLLSNPLQLSTFLSEVVGLSSDEIMMLERQPEELAWVVSQIYDLPKDKVRFTEKNETILAAIGSTTLVPETQEEFEALFNFRNTEDVKRATLIDHDYTGKDKLNIASGNEEGFSQSDVALLRVSAEHTPLIQLASPADIMPGQSITILGFPSDAENELVDHSELVTTVTNGTISSIRTAAGGKGTLLQTDADASQGNSGGPAVTSAGKVVGLLTYRYKDQTTQNAAKSYLRDIGDLRNLLERQDLALNLNSQTQQAWSKGLELYAASHFSDSLEHFNRVAELYPAHRLVDRYIDAAETNIADGNDRSTPTLQYAGIIGGTGLLAFSSRMIRQHRIHHNLYKEEYGIDDTPPVPPADHQE